MAGSVKDAAVKVRKAIGSAGALIIGAGAGLSISAGFTYDGERFERYFADFEAKYRFHDMYSGGFYPYATLEETWAYWSRYVLINRYMEAPRPVYEKLLSVVKGKDYFIITTNVDHCFQKAGFDKSRLFYTQGDYGLFQCSKPCRQATYDNEEAIREMCAKQKDGKIPSELIPRCPVCGRPMVMNLRIDNTFVEDEGWRRASGFYSDFIKRSQNAGVVYLELGVGLNTPGVIKFRFWEQVRHNPKALYICVNSGEAYAPPEIEERSICIDEDIGNLLDELTL